MEECVGFWKKKEDMIVFEIRDCDEHNSVLFGGGEERLYAFYVFHNGKRILTRWYEASPKAAVTVSGEGLYYATGFIKDKNCEPRIITSSPVQILQEREPFVLPQVSVSIFGSCVSRDLFEYNPASNLKLDLYFARQSIVSAVSDQIPFDDNEIFLESNFQKKQIIYDFNKSAIGMLKDKASDYLIIDLVDERFPLIKIAGSYATRSEALVRSGLIDKSETVIEKEEYADACGNTSYRVDDKDIREYLDIFCNEILHIFEPERIILHIVKGAEFYYDKDLVIRRFEPNTAGYFRKLNRMWQFMYEYLCERLSGCICIDVSPRYLADEKHVWGLSPIHFQKEYYENVLREINKAITGIHSDSLRR